MGPALVLPSPPFLYDRLEVKHVSGAWDGAKEWEMSQMNTCQVMSSPVSTDDQPQLFQCTEAQSATPVWRHFKSHNCSTEKACCSQGFHESLAMKSAEVKRGRQYISNRFHTASVAENKMWYSRLRISLFLSAKGFLFSVTGVETLLVMSAWVFLMTSYDTHTHTLMCHPYYAKIES